MSTAAATPVAPRAIRRPSDFPRPKTSQQDNSPRTSAHVPREIPVGRAVRYAVQIDGVTCTIEAAARSAPMPARPPTTTATSSARTVAAVDGRPAVQ